MTENTNHPSRPNEQPANKTKDREISPFSEESLDDPFCAQRWLMKRGWKPMGSARDPNCRWWDPTRKTVDTYFKKVRLAPHVTVWNTEKKCYDTEMQPVMVKDRTSRAIPCEQTVLVPAGQPYEINMALTLQREREREANEAAALAEQRQQEAAPEKKAS